MATCGICGVAGHNRAKCGLRYDMALRKTVRASLAALDAAMRGPSTPERGKQVAAVCNALEMALDQAEHFGAIKATTT